MSENLQTTMDKKSKIRKGELIEMCGLVFYPILMCDYEKFLAFKDSLLLRQTTFPARYMSQMYLSALWQMELDAITAGKPTSGMFFRLISLLFMSLRIDMTTESLQKSICCDSESGKLQHIAITQNENTVDITPMMFSAQIRPLIAEMNGLKLPDETQNPQLVKDAEDKRKADSTVDLEYDLEELIASVAHQSGIRERDIDNWTVREFEAKRRAISRSLNFLKYGQAELSGMVTFKKGNPYPSWEFDRKDDSLGMMKLSETAIGSFISATQGTKP